MIYDNTFTGNIIIKVYQKKLSEKLSGTDMDLVTTVRKKHKIYGISVFDEQSHQRETL